MLPSVLVLMIAPSMVTIAPLADALSRDFLAASDEMFAKRLRYDILPLLDDYLRQGVLGSAAPELHAVRNALEDEYLLEAHG